MKLATLRNGRPDGALVLVSRDLDRACPAPPEFPTLLAALDIWSEAEPALRARASALEAGRTPDIFRFDPTQAMAPLPRTWQWLDGSAFPSHGELMQKVFGLDPHSEDLPLMYQGLSHLFYGPTETVPFIREEDGIDFEGEFAVMTDAVPIGTTAADAARHIKLLVQVNDWSLRALAPREMKTGFGWIQAKPPCSMAPVAVTPDELSGAWRNSRVHLPLRVSWNDVDFGRALGDAMQFGFDELLAHAAATRPLPAGTVIGSGTVSNPDFRVVGSSCIAERRAIELLDEGSSRTAYLRFGDKVRMEVLDADARSVFGAIEQRVARAETATAR